VVERARCMLEDAGLEKSFWAEAVTTAVFLKNISPTRALGDGKTSHEVWFGDKPTVQHLRVFGCLAFMHIPDEKRKKWDLKAIRGIFVGYSLTTKQYRVYDPVTKRLHISRDVIFREEKRYELEKQLSQELSDNQIHFDFEDTQPEIRHKVTVAPQQEDTVRQPVPVSETQTVTKSKSGRELRGLASNLGDYWDKSAVAGSSCRQTRSSAAQAAERIVEIESDSELSELEDGAAMLVTLRTSVDHWKDAVEPRNLREALESPQREQWLLAMQEEANAVRQNGVYTIVDLPAELSRGCTGHRLWVAIVRKWE
jgi:hypothetical protein